MAELAMNLHVTNVEYYTGVDERLDLPVMMLPPVPSAVDLSGTRLLIADDVADTGTTLRLVKDFCADHVADVRLPSSTRSHGCRRAGRNQSLAGRRRRRRALAVFDQQVDVPTRLMRLPATVGERAAPAVRTR